MSFSMEVKSEVSKESLAKTEIVSLLSAIIKNIGDINESSIKISTENSAFARKIFKIFKDNYDVICKITVRKRYNFNNRLTYILEVNKKVDVILLETSIIKDNKLQNIPDEYIYSSDEEIIAYLKGCFLAIGSVNDPKTSRYHLEFLVDNFEYAVFLSQLLNDYDFNSKIIKRTKGYMLYMKEAEKISDFLKIMKAYHSVLYYEDIRIYRDHKNMVNRLNNCEQANVDKIFETARKQIEDIDKIYKADMLELLDEKTKIVMEYRLKYPESSLQELSEIISLETEYKLTKSGLNHKFRKIKEIANNIREMINRNQGKD